MQLFASGCSIGQQLVQGRERFDVKFQGLIVLALNLEFRLQFLDQKLETRNFGLELLYIAARRRPAG